MFKRFTATFVLVTIFMFGSVIAVSASASDTGQGSKEAGPKVWKQENTIHYYIKTYFGKWQPSWQASKPEQNNQGQDTTVESQNPSQDSQEIIVEDQDQDEGKLDKGDLNQFEQEVVKLTNAERAKVGLAPLAIDGELSRVAREKSRDMASNHYFSHTSPVYGSPFDMIRAYGINYRSAGENIAKGQVSPEEVVRAWMNSQGHRENILNGSFTHIGVGYVEQGRHWTQMFIGK